jgi:hypothetical protein
MIDSDLALLEPEHNPHRLFSEIDLDSSCASDERMVSR